MSDICGITLHKYELHFFVDFYGVVQFDGSDEETAVEYAPEICGWFKVDPALLGTQVHLIDAETKEVLL